MGNGKVGVLENQFWEEWLKRRLACCGTVVRCTLESSETLQPGDTFFTKMFIADKCADHRVSFTGRRIPKRQKCLLPLTFVGRSSCAFWWNPSSSCGENPCPGGRWMRRNALKIWGLTYLFFQSVESVMTTCGMSLALIWPVFNSGGRGDLGYLNKTEVVREHWL